MKILCLIAAVAAVSACSAEASQPPFFASSRTPHQVRYLPTGASALQQRLKMIEGAQTSIELEYYEYDNLQAGALVTQALLKKKREIPSIHIRLMVDYYSWGGKPDLTNQEIAMLTQGGIEVAFFNVASKAELWKVGHRDHSKLLAVDDREFIVGGRNIGDDYFDLEDTQDPKTFSYLDTDLWVRGETARAARERFDVFWKDPIVQRAYGTSPKDKGYADGLEWARGLVADTPERQALRARIAETGEADLARYPVIDVSNATLVGDRPGGSAADRTIAPFLLDRLTRVAQSLSVLNYSFLPTSPTASLFQSLRARGVAIDVMTNGFASAEGDPRVVFLAQDGKKKMTLNGVRIFEFQGNAPHGAKSNYGIHAKDLVIDDKAVWVASANLDPRSFENNVELGVMIENSPELAKQVVDFHRTVQDQSRQLAPGGATYTDGSPVTQGLSPEEIRQGQTKNILYKWFRKQF